MGKNRFSVKTGEDKVVNAEGFLQSIYLHTCMQTNTSRNSSLMNW